MKRTPLSRRTPLQRQQLQRQRDDHLSRRAGVMPSRDTGPDPAVRKAVEARDAGCAYCNVRGLGAFPPHAIHHRRPRQMGGSRRADTNSPANLLYLCAQCHTMIESNRTAAYRAGLLLRSNENPADVPVLWHGRLVFLRHDGAVIPAP